MKTLVDIPQDVKDALKLEALERGTGFGDVLRAVLQKHTDSRKARAAKRVKLSGRKKSKPHGKA